MTSGDVESIAALVRDRDAWQRLALTAIDILRSLETASASDNWEGQHEQQMRTIERTLIRTALGKFDGTGLQVIYDIWSWDKKQ